MPKQAITLKEFEELDLRDLVKYDDVKLEKIILTLRTSIGRRIANIEKHNEVSYAAYALTGVDPYAEDGSKSYTEGYKELMDIGRLKAMSRNQKLGLAARLQAFVQAKSATYKGIKELNKAQDIRIFGADKNGRPLRTLNATQRKILWKLYDEFDNQFNIGGRFASTRIQSYLGEMVRDNNMLDLSDDEILAIIYNAKEDIERENNFGVYNLKGDGYNNPIYTA